MSDDDSSDFDPRKKIHSSPVSYDTPPTGSRTSWVSREIRRVETKLDGDKVDKDTHYSEMKGLGRQLADIKSLLEKKADDSTVVHIDKQAQEAKTIALSVNRKLGERECGQLGRFKSMEKAQNATTKALEGLRKDTKETFEKAEKEAKDEREKAQGEAKDEREKIMGKIDKTLKLRWVAVVGFVITIGGAGFGYARSFGKVEEAQVRSDSRAATTNESIISMTGQINDLKLAVQSAQQSDMSSEQTEEEVRKEFAKEVLKQYDEERKKKKKKKDK